MWFDNSLHPRATTNKFHYYKFGIKQIGVKALSQTQIPKTPKQLSLTNANQRTKGSQIPNTKCEFHTNKRESHKAHPKVAMHQESANHQTAKPSSNKPLSLFQITTHKYQRTKQKRASFSHTHTPLNLPQFIQDIQVGKDASPSSNRICNAISLCPHAPY